MMPPKMVPRALVSLGMRMTRTAGWPGPVLAAAEISFIGVPGPFAQVSHAILAALRSRADRQMPETDPVPAQRGVPGRPPALLSDAALLRGIVERRPEALSELYDRHAPTLLALARRIL